MAWGDAGVSKHIRISSGQQAWGVGGQPMRLDVQQTAILQELTLLSTGTPTFTPGTGTVALDKQGPFNSYSRIQLSPNAQAPIVNVTGYGLSLINELLFSERMGNDPSAQIITPVNADTATNVYNGSATTGTTPLNYFQIIPVAQRIRSLGGFVGLFPLQNPAVLLSLYVTPNSASTASPFNIYSTTALTEPYLVTGNATVTLASPTVEIVRDMWEVPQRQQDYPPFSFISSWAEEAPQTSVVGATQVTWKATPLSGILLRVIGYIVDGGTNNGIAASSLTAPNAVTLTYGNNTAKFAETASDAQQRQWTALGHQMPQGSYYYDLMGADLTLQDTLDLFSIANVSYQFNIASALASGSSAKILRQLLQPLVVQ